MELTLELFCIRLLWISFEWFEFAFEWLESLSNYCMHNQPLLHKSMFRTCDIWFVDTTVVLTKKVWSRAQPSAPPGGERLVAWIEFLSWKCVQRMYNDCAKNAIIRPVRVLVWSHDIGWLTDCHVLYYRLLNLVFSIKCVNLCFSSHTTECGIVIMPHLHVHINLSPSAHIVCKWRSIHIS